jgi:NADH:ubiquinone oxidoreductase subunit 4 (subunit M)
MNTKMRSILCFNFLCHLQWLELLSLRWFIVLYFWELALIPIYFIALIWGNGDAEERKKQ